MLIEGTNDNRCVEVTEEDDGYERLIEEMPVRLRGLPLPSEWWKKWRFRRSSCVGRSFIPEKREMRNEGLDCRWGRVVHHPTGTEEKNLVQAGTPLSFWWFGLSIRL